MDLPILSLITFLPLAGAVFILLVRGEPAVVARNVRWVALWTALIVFVLSLGVWMAFDPSTAEFQFVERATWMPGLNISYHMGVDGISLPFILLSALLTPICIVASWTSVTERVKEYMVAFLVMETMMIGMFSALDLILFYVFFEATLIPMFLIIGVWGGPRRVYAAFKFFLYTLAGSVLMLLAMLAMVIVAGTTDIPTLLTYDFPRQLQTWLWLAFLASFAVKVPMWPVHTWLPDAHVEAPTAGSVILAGVLLKFGGYGFLRFSLPMFPEASIQFVPLIFGLSVIAIIYTSLVALAQEDMKKLIAYSSVAHMGFVTIGAFTMTTQGVEGAIFQMISHGIVSAALFLIVGVVYDRMHSREISSYGGLVHRMPMYAAVFMLFMLASVGLPGTSGFVGEFLILAGAFRVHSWVAAFAALGIILGAAYMLYLYRRVVLGALTKESLMRIKDLTPREIAVFAPLVVLVLWMGIYPSPFLDMMHVSVDNLVNRLELARAGLEAVNVAGQ
jgi:NADH-quinone oxidoreductase subunit M